MSAPTTAASVGDEAGSAAARAMRAWFMVSDAAQGRLELRDVPVPRPGPGQLLVRMHAASLNRGEFIVGHGLQKAGTTKAAGMEGAGEIVAVGGGDADFAPGQRVMGRCGGAFAEYALMDAREAIAIPPALSFAEGAAIPLTFLVAHDMLVLQGRLQPGEWLLVTGVSSGVGVAALQLAKALGAHVVGTSGSAEKLERLAAHGLDIAIRTRAADFGDAVLQATAGKGVNLAVNTVGGSMFAECVRVLAFEGRLATVGYVDGVLTSEIDIQALHAKRLVLFGVSNKLRTPEQRAAGVPAFVRDVLPAIGGGRIRPLIDRVFPFERLDDARACMEENRHVGKIVLSIAGATSGETA